MANSPKENFVQKVVATKNKIGKGLESVGSNIRKNVDQGQADLQSGKSKYYASINPLKGTVDAYKQGYAG
jgi:hypothetical protein